MSKDDLQLAASGQKQAFIRDGALILYFDKAETPFVARFDLDSLAQANFEVVDKKDGHYHLTLRDYTGEAQTIGVFASKNDSHQALYLILQALLDQPVVAGGCCPVTKKPCGVWRFFKALLKYTLFVLVVVFLLYHLLTWPIPVEQAAVATRGPATTSSLVPEQQVPGQAQAPAASGLSALPQGEAVDADALLGQENTAPDTSATAEEPTE